MGSENLEVGLGFKKLGDGGGGDRGVAEVEGLEVREI